MVGEGEPVVAVVGRPNVGKSTLVNRLAGRRVAIADPSSGVTRDRIEVPCVWRGRRFRLVDTGGFLHRPRGLDASVRQQALAALDVGDLVLLVVDAVTGIQEEDGELARLLRRTSLPVLVVANKVDSPAQASDAAAFYSLGFGEPLAVSSLHGRGTGDLLDRILAALPDVAPQPKVEIQARFSVVGRPNVGKSSLFNRVVGQERSVIHDAAGTTRDPVDTVVEFDGRPVRFVDTAGLRRAVKTKGVEYYGLLRSLRAVDQSDVALLVVDASGGLTGEDKRIAAQVMDAGRGLVVVLNKWDLVARDERAALFRDTTEEVQLFAGAPTLRASALTGAGVGRILPALLNVHTAWSRRLPTSNVNQALTAAVDSYPPKGGRLRYGTQVSAGPPTFVIFGTLLPDPAYRRYLENSFRRSFGLSGVPLRLSFRVRPSRSKTSKSR